MAVHGIRMVHGELSGRVRDAARRIGIRVNDGKGLGNRQAEERVKSPLCRVSLRNTVLEGN